jgi:hypothetical protein
LFRFVPTTKNITGKAIASPVEKRRVRSFLQIIFRTKLFRYFLGEHLTVDYACGRGDDRGMPSVSSVFVNGHKNPTDIYSLANHVGNSWAVFCCFAIDPILASALSSELARLDFS